MSELINHAEREFAIIMEGVRADPEQRDSVHAQASQHQDALNILRLLSAQGHSGGSIRHMMGLINSVVSMEPLTPLRGTSDEWINIYDDDGVPVYQNTRCAHVFKRGTEAYDSQGRTLVDQNGRGWNNAHSRVTISFPYTPKIVYAPSDEDRARFEKVGIEICDYATKAEVLAMYAALAQAEALLASE